MMIGIGMPSSQSRIGMTQSPFFSLPRPRNEAAIVPGSVAELTTLDSSEARRERAEEQSGGHPEGELCGALASAIGSSLRLHNDIVHTFLGVGLAQAGLRGNDASNVGSVGSGKVAVGPEAGGPQSQHLSARRVAVSGRAGP